jgi:hypothetical protein
MKRVNSDLEEKERERKLAEAWGRRILNVHTSINIILLFLCAALI